MTLTTIIIIIEVIVAFGLLVWLIRKAHKHVKSSPAEKALQKHLVELQSVKIAKKDLKK